MHHFQFMKLPVTGTSPAAGFFFCIKVNISMKFFRNYAYNYFKPLTHGFLVSVEYKAICAELFMICIMIILYSLWYVSYI